MIYNKSNVWFNAYLLPYRNNMHDATHEIFRPKKKWKLLPIVHFFSTQWTIEFPFQRSCNGVSFEEDESKMTPDYFFFFWQLNFLNFQRNVLIIRNWNILRNGIKFQTPKWSERYTGFNNQVSWDVFISSWYITTSEKWKTAHCRIYT